MAFENLMEKQSRLDRVVQEIICVREQTLVEWVPIVGWQDDENLDVIKGQNLGRGYKKKAKKIGGKNVVPIK